MCNQHCRVRRDWTDSLLGPLLRFPHLQWRLLSIASFTVLQSDLQYDI